MPRKFITKDQVPEEMAPELPIINPNTPTRPNKLKLWKKISFGLGLILLFTLVPLLAVSSWYLSSFSLAAGVTNKYILSTAWQALTDSPKQQVTQTNFLILGLDEILGQKDDSFLTDTIIVASINHQTHQLHLLPIPRDLWIDSFKTKVNALYYYGNLSADTTGPQFTTKVIEDITGLPINHTFVIKLDLLENIITTMGGVDINVPVAFTDDKFPKSDVDIHKTKEEDLYETISFQAGQQHMSGKQALKYIRSRHSQDQEQGIDNARSKRQQDLLKAITQKISTKNTILNPNVMGTLYKTIRAEEGFSDISDLQAIEILKNLGQNIPEINTHSISTEFEEVENPLLTNPPISKYKQWVYEPVDPTWQQLQDFVETQLN